ncbi:MAG TPA: cupin domain-containing protein [Pyrinomonadaceae bacterium]|jgi:mannose-6-phosphate isomerase-like protein (cupin superfamily)
MKFSIEEFAAELPLPASKKWKDGVWDIEAFRKRSVSLIFFAPQGADFQTFHEEDELYFIVRGAGELIVKNERFVCGVGDSFFVPAKAPHRFENFTADFATWAIFF